MYTLHSARAGMDYCVAFLSKCNITQKCALKSLNVYSQLSTPHPPILLHLHYPLLPTPPPCTPPPSPPLLPILPQGWGKEREKKIEGLTCVGQTGVKCLINNFPL